MRLLVAGFLLLGLQSASGQVVSPVRPRAQVKPFTMTQTTTTSRTYANGMTSTETKQNTLVRDSEGRMRNEQEMAATPGMKFVLDNGGSRIMHGRGKFIYIFVTDPVGRTSLNWSTDPDAAKEVRLTHTRQFAPGPRGVRTLDKAEDGLVAEEKVEKLGTRALQGVIAEGTRRTTHYPAGAFGMSQEFTVVSENWVAQDCGISVEGTTDDPRTGKIVTTLVSFSDAEPDAGLFKPPAGYSVISDVKVDEVAEKQ
jgi:hypothetical protein